MDDAYHTRTSPQISCSEPFRSSQNLALPHRNLYMPGENPEDAPRKSKRSDLNDTAHASPISASPNSRLAQRKVPNQKTTIPTSNLRDTHDDFFSPNNQVEGMPPSDPMEQDRENRASTAMSNDDEGSPTDGSKTPTAGRVAEHQYNTVMLDERDRNTRDPARNLPNRDPRPAPIPFRIVNLDPFVEVAMHHSLRATENPHFQSQRRYSHSAQGSLGSICRNTGRFPIVTTTFTYLTKLLSQSTVDRITATPDQWIALVFFNAGQALFNSPIDIDTTVDAALNDAGCNILAMESPWLEKKLLDNGGKPKKRGHQGNSKSEVYEDAKYGGSHTTVVRIDNEESIELLAGIGTVGVNSNVGFHVIRFSNVVRSWVLVHLVSANRDRSSQFGQRLLYAVKQKASTDGAVIKIIGQGTSGETPLTKRVENWVGTFDFMYMGPLRKLGSTVHHWVIFAAPFADTGTASSNDLFESQLRDHFKVKNGEEITYEFDGALAKVKLVSCTLCKSDAHHQFQCPFYDRGNLDKDQAELSSLEPILGWTGPNKEVSRTSQSQDQGSSDRRSSNRGRGSDNGFGRRSRGRGYRGRW